MSGEWFPLSNTLVLTLSETISDDGTLDPSAWSITLTDANPRISPSNAFPAGPNLILEGWSAGAGLGLFDRVSFTGAGGPVVGVSGGVLQAFANFPITIA